MRFSLSHPTLVYLAVVGGVGLVALVALRQLFRRQESVRKDQVDRLKRFVAIKQPPGSDPIDTARDRAIESVETRYAMIRRVTFPVLLVVWLVLLAMPFLGRVPATLASVMITGLTVVVGIAAKPMLENAIAGMIISFSQPLRIGDLVLLEDRHYGIVEEISLTYTMVKLWDWRRYVIPNQRLLQTPHINYSIVDRWQWAYVPFWVSHEADFDRVREIAIAAVAQSPVHVQGTDTGFWIIEMNKEGVVCWIAGWVDHPLDAWTMRHGVAKQLAATLSAEGIRAHVYHHEGPASRDGAVPPVPPQPPEAGGPPMPPGSPAGHPGRGTRGPEPQ